ncbi:MAG: hypothetical protein A3F84_10830 [Candidatus Handelsmanbacteria bacterium RIFCSPLOWO2_12_FULL_64_10]|uniref:Uncharacterized protein n=1 Tax=Handelsmanbacteria sp. (strain RIFCSPLOWO2_12_FULL_64_10) TaxID=1817868 RepID=A0A1F6D642_HANXR|nr:MAG: hypothetical protein A3F84_10830 [Candidatus Handelsmanbacteria bacterium RIFCSPLOWO2_12_FULL_64_10]
MITRQRYAKPEVYEVLLDVSQAVLAACKSGVNNAKQGNRTGWCKNNCKMGQGKGGSNSRASS